MRKAAITLGGLAFLSSAGQLHAEDMTDIEGILSEQVITTASTTAQTASAAPALSRTITAEDLRLYGIRNLAEAVDFLGLGVVTGDPLRTPDIGSRGVLFTRDDGKHFLLLVNGHAVNDPLYGAARFDEGAGVPFELIDRIEVIVGPGSVLYGSNAMMGVINVITRNAADYEGGHAAVRYEAGASYGAFAGAGMTFDLFGAPSEMTVGVDYFRRFGPDLDFDRQSFVGIFATPELEPDFGSGGNGVWGGTVREAYFAEAPSALLRLRVGDFELNVMASAYRRGIPYANEAESVTFDDTGSYELDRALRLDLRHHGAVSKLVQVGSRVYADGFDYQRHARFPGQICLVPSRRCEYYDVGRARWIGIDEQLSLNWLHDSSLVTLVGLDVRQRWVGAKQDFSDPDTGQYLGPTVSYMNEDSVLVAPYLQQTYSPTAWLDLNAGARLDADDRFSPVVSPRGAIAVRPWEKTSFKAIYSQAFRAPTWSETDLATRVVAPSDDVAPEKVRSVEGSIEQRFGAQRVTFGVFRSWWDDLIDSTALSAAEQARLETERRIPLVVGNQLIQYRNVSSIENYGWNGGFEGSLGTGRFRYGLNATAAFTKVHDSLDDELPAAPRLFGNARAAYAFGGYAPTAALSAQLLGPRASDRQAVGGDDLPSAPALGRLRLTLTGASGIDGLGYSASAEYLTADRGPYAAGPAMSPRFLLPGAAPDPEPGQLPRYRIFFALRYDFASGADGGEDGVVE